MIFKIAVTVLSSLLVTAAYSVETSGTKEFGHWVAWKSIDEFNPNNSACMVQSGTWYGETHHSPEIYAEGTLRLYVDRKSLTSSGVIENDYIAFFAELDRVYNEYVYSSDLYAWGTDANGIPNNVVAKVDGKMVDFLSNTLPEELKGKVELTYRYQATRLDNAPTITNTISLIGFTQAWNYARELCR